MTLLEQLNQKAAALSEQQQREVLAYIDQLCQQRPHLADPYGSCADLRRDLAFEEFAPTSPKR